MTIFARKFRWNSIFLIIFYHKNSQSTAQQLSKKYPTATVTIHHDQIPSTSTGGETTISDLLKKRKKVLSDSSSNSDSSIQIASAVDDFYDSDASIPDHQMNLLSDSDEASQSEQEFADELEFEDEQESGYPKMFQSTWELVKEFKSKDEFKVFLKSEGCWSFRSQKLASGIKTYWRCNLVKSTGCQCEAELYSLHNYAPVTDMMVMMRILGRTIVIWCTVETLNIRTMKQKIWGQNCQRKLRKK